MSSAAREVATSIVKALRDAGHQAVFAGGCVRDELLGLEPKDYDIATDATPDRVAKLFPGTREVGKSFGVVPVVRRVRGERVAVEVATFREEEGYSDKRRPDTVRFSDARNDALRRDFTINALFIDPLAPEAQGKGRVIDYVGGLDDLRRGIIRAVGDPEARLAEDHLRALRAVRFTARLSFALDIATAAAIRAHARDLAGVSRERIGDEVRRMMSHPSRAAAAVLMVELGLDSGVLADSAHGGNAAPPTLARLPAECPLEAALAAWAIDRAELDGRLDGAALAEQSGPIATRWRRALCLSNEERDALAGTIEGVGRLESQWAGMGVAPRKRFAAGACFRPAMLILAARSPRHAEAVEADVRELALTPGGIAPVPLVSGDDLVAAGLEPGPIFGRLLEQVYDAQLEGRVGDRGSALQLALRLASGGRK
jgi:hypothetical protein